MTTTMNRDNGYVLVDRRSQRLTYREFDSGEDDIDTKRYIIIEAIYCTECERCYPVYNRCFHFYVPHPLGHDLMLQIQEARTLIQKEYERTRYDRLDWGRNMLMFAVRFVQSKVQYILDDIANMNMYQQTKLLTQYDQGGLNALLLAVRFELPLDPLISLLKLIEKLPEDVRSSIFNRKTRFGYDVFECARVIAEHQDQHEPHRCV